MKKDSGSQDRKESSQEKGEKKEKLKDMDSERHNENSERDNYKVSHLPVDRKERIVPPRLPNSKRDNCYMDSVELAEKAGASRVEVEEGIGINGLVVEEDRSGHWP